MVSRFDPTKSFLLLSFSSLSLSLSFLVADFDCEMCIVEGGPKTGIVCKQQYEFRRKQIEVLLFLFGARKLTIAVRRKNASQ